MIFLTFNDLPSGIYKSQVIDVIKLLRCNFNVKIKLVAFVSSRIYFVNKKKIKELDSDALVLPMFPSIKRWKINKYIFSIVQTLYKDKFIIARGSLAAYIALQTKQKGQKICYDGRAANHAEALEYDVFSDPTFTKDIGEVERYVVTKSDYRIAVSQQLVEYWKDCFSYKSNKHAVIPCTLSDDFDTINIHHEHLNIYEDFGWTKEDIIVIYSGSNQKWQSFELVEEIFTYLINSNDRIRILFMTDTDSMIDSFVRKYPEKTKRVWVKHALVKEYLKIGSYGIMLREQTITNKVASPVKFAEYLSCGLKVLCSPELGDYSSFVENNKCGFIVSKENFKNIKLEKISFDERLNIQKLGLLNFSKKSDNVLLKYKSLVDNFIVE